MDTELSIDEPFDAGLQTVFEAVITGSDAIVDGATREILMSKNQCVHFGMDGKIVFHGAVF